MLLKISLNGSLHSPIIETLLSFSEAIERLKTYNMRDPLLLGLYVVDLTPNLIQVGTSSSQLLLLEDHFKVKLVRDMVGVSLKVHLDFLK